MVRYLVGVVLAGVLSACGRAPEPLPAPFAVPAVLPAAVAPASAAVAETTATMAEPATACALTPPVSEPGIELVVAFEIVSPRYYSAHLLRPIWPGGASGATIGIGYDLGHQVAPVIRDDWHAHERAEDLTRAAGVVGEPARALVIGMRDIQTGFPLAEGVFAESTVPRYWRATARAFPGVAALCPGARDALFSLVYNRGTAMAGEQRREMRTIRDDCVPAADYACIAEQILNMRRIWRGTDIEAGMARRREAEAALAVQ